MAGLSLCVAAAWAVLALRGDRTEVDPAGINSDRTRPASASPAAASTALAQFVSGVQARSATDLSDLAPDDDPDAAARLAGIAANARSLDVRGLSARYIDQAGPVAADGSWPAVVELTWRFAGVDAVASRAEVVVEFAPDGSGLGIAGFGAGTAETTADQRLRAPLWLREELAVVQDRRVLVMADGPRQLARETAEETRRGIEVVRRVLPQWGGPVVVEVLASAADLDAALGVRPGTYAGIAAVTAEAGSTGSAEAPIHVFVNAGVVEGLRPAGAQVVISHELVHVATDAPRTPTEPWLLEGFADYVALRDTALPDRVTLSRAIASARKDGVPRVLPGAAELDTRAPDLQARYEQAWLACRVIAQRLGEQGLVEVYRDAASGTDVARALRRAGLPVAELTRVWREELRAQITGS